MVRNRIFIRKKELAQMLGVSKSTLWRMERRGDLPKSESVTLGSTGWWKEDLDNWVALKRAGSITSQSNT